MMNIQHKSISVAVAQGNFTVGDLESNADRVISCMEAARAAGADLVLTPELALAGYPPEDLLLRPDFYRACARETARIVEASRGLCVVLGHPVEADEGYFNAASVIVDGRLEATYHKHLLPNYEVFDEERYFEAGLVPCVFDYKGVRLGVTICADLWEQRRRAARAARRVLLSLNASPFHMNKQQRSTRCCVIGCGRPACPSSTATWLAGRTSGVRRWLVCGGCG